MNTIELLNMEIVQTESVKVPNSLLVSGPTRTDDDEIFDYLKTHGSISRLILIDDKGSEYYQQTIVEYAHGSAIQSIEPELPLDYTSKSDATYHVETLASVYILRSMRSTVR